MRGKNKSKKIKVIMYIKDLNITYKYINKLKLIIYNIKLLNACNKHINVWIN